MSPLILGLDCKDDGKMTNGTLAMIRGEMVGQTVFALFSPSKILPPGVVEDDFKRYIRD
jgi:hypothetical protein